MVDKTKYAQQVLCLFLLSGCSFFVKSQGATACDDGAAPRCEETTLVVCEGGFEARVPCTDGCAVLPEAHCTVCGDAIPEAPEACDDGNAVTNDGCEPSCTLSPDCGDGALQIGEQCDDGNNLNNDDCSDSCLFEICGDGVTQANEECDGGPDCRTDCRVSSGAAPVCGDGLPDDGEVCDDGNLRSGDGCSFDCTAAESCGNGALDVNENCELADVGCVSCQFSSCENDAIDAGELCFKAPGQELSPGGSVTAGAVFFSSAASDNFLALSRTQAANHFVRVVGLAQGNFNIRATATRTNPTVLMARGRRALTDLSDSFLGIDSAKGVFLASFTGNAIAFDFDAVFNALPAVTTIKQIGLADLSGDTIADLIFLDGGGVRMLSADCDPFCNTITNLANTTLNPTRMVIAEMNGDNKPDLIVASNGDATNEASIQVFLNNFPTFTLGAGLALGFEVFSFVGLVAEDFDKDNDLDIVAACDGNGNATDKLLIVENIGAANAPQLPVFGALTTPTISVGGVGLALLEAADVDKDGIPDLIASTETSRDLIVLKKVGALQSANAFSVLARYALKNQPLLIAFNGLASGGTTALASLFAGGVEVLFSSF